MCWLATRDISCFWPRGKKLEEDGFGVCLEKKDEPLGAVRTEAEQAEDVGRMLAKDEDSDSAPRGIRTHDPRFRRPVLLSAEL